MKIVKILFILLVPAFGFVGCQKADMKPGSCGDHNKNNTATTNNAPSDARSAAVSNTSQEENNSGNGGASNARTINGKDDTFTNGADGTNPSDIIGSGDDDRDGGDKKKKTTAK